MMNGQVQGVGTGYSLGVVVVVGVGARGRIGGSMPCVSAASRSVFHLMTAVENG